MRLNPVRAWRNLAPLCCVGVFTLATASCAGAPQYDPTTDAQITSLQQEVDSQVVQFISLARRNDPDALKKGSYAQNVDFYNKVNVDTTALELRMEAVADPSTAKMPQIFDNLRTQVGNIQADHQKKGNLSAIVWTASRNQLNATFAVLLTYELSLKGVNSPTSSTTQSTATTTAAAKASAAPAAP